MFAGGGADDVAEDGSRLDGGQLVGVTDEDQAGVSTDGVDEVGHHRGRHHRRLVHDHDVVGQPVGAVVAEPAAGAGPPAEEPVERGRGDPAVA